MSESKSKRPGVNRREFVQTRRGGRRHAVRLAMEWPGRSRRADGIRRLEIPARGARAQPEVAAACCATASPSRPPHFDVHQSGTINNLGSQGCMFDNLIRRDPRDSGKTIIPDLAHSWEISKDGKTYTFYPAQGRAVPRRRRAHRRRTSRRPSTASSSRRRDQHPAQHRCSRRSSEINAPDKYTVEFKLVRAAAAQLHHGGDRQRLERASSARRRWRTTTTTCAASSTSPAPARSRASAGSRTKSG